MSLTMNFEADCKIQKQEVLSALESAGADLFSEERSGSSGNFSASNMSFFISERSNISWIENGLGSSVIAEGASGQLEWDICMRISFQIATSKYFECVKELQQFLGRLAELSRANFLLSFQYETVYVIRDEEGLRFIKEF